ncbi:MAG TPA: gamma-glutamyl-gamma-aminobutyrate hydrolase family protein [Gemmatimonadaceae bacterium]|nr:gamma-glutamyl-gamma-aminobutyrate hydrolase family protein [Gemmatimonadaceae bacterium]
MTAEHTRTPIIGITALLDRSGSAPRVRASEAYVRATERAGGLPLLVPPLEHAAPARRLVEELDAVLLTGGEDVDPARYGAAPHPATEPPCALRDDTEIALVQHARALRRPVLAICRGIQVLNIALAGTLVQDLPSERPSDIAHTGTPRAERSHAVRVAPGSRLAAALALPAGGEIRVNSAHHQAVDRPAAGLRATAWAPDGVIEGVEWDGDDWWAIGVQWHPEDLTRTHEGWDRALFDAFVAAARAAHAARR